MWRKFKLVWIEKKKKGHSLSETGEINYIFIVIFLPIVDFLTDQASEGELAAFIAYAQAFPNGFLALIDTYDVIR